MIYIKGKKFADSSFEISSNNELYMSLTENKIRRLIKPDKAGNELESLNFIKAGDLWGWNLSSEYLLVYSMDDYKTTIYSLNNHHEVFHSDKYLSSRFLFEDDIYMYIYRENLCRFNKVTKVMEEFPHLPEDDALFPLSMYKNYVIASIKDELVVYQSNENSFDRLWRRSIRDYLPEGSSINLNFAKIIHEVKEYEGDFIVATYGGTFRISPEDGALKWHARGAASNFEIVGNIGYSSTNAALSRINLDTGEKAGYGRELHSLPPLYWAGKKYSPFCDRMNYHDGYLWTAIWDSGESFIVSINPETGEYDHVIYLDIDDRAWSPTFYEGNMFIADSGFNLHVYEKVE